MDKQLEDLRNDVREIKIALIGNEKLGQQGIVHRVNKHGDYIANDKKNKSKAFGVFIGLQFAWAAVMAWVRLKV